jgi:hypothetical protein
MGREGREADNMPTNRTKTRRTRTNTESVKSWVKWDLSILQYCLDVPKWRRKDFVAFWKKNKDAIMVEYLKEIKRRNRPFKRPTLYFLELGEKNPPLPEVWYEDHTGKFIDEEHDEDYLLRLGLLEPWEMKVLSADPYFEAKMQAGTNVPPNTTDENNKEIQKNKEISEK